MRRRRMMTLLASMLVLRLALLTAGSLAAREPTGDWELLPVGSDRRENPVSRLLARLPG